MAFTLGLAAKHTGRSKATISGDIKSGKLSAEKQENGSYSIQGAELSRVYGDAFSPEHPKTVQDNVQVNEAKPSDLSFEHRALAAEAEVNRLRDLSAEWEKQRGLLIDTLNDLRRRLDDDANERRQAAEERRKLTAILTDQRSLTVQSPVQSVPEPQKTGIFGLFRRR